MVTNQEMLAQLAGLVQTHIAQVSGSRLFEAKYSAGELILGVRNPEGGTQRFHIKVEELGEARWPSQHPAQSHEGTVHAAQASDGCCEGMQTCCKAKEASPTQEELHGGCEEQAAPDPSATEAPAI